MEDDEERTIVEPSSEWYPEEVKYAYNTHMAFYAKDFWRDPLKAKANLDQRHNANGRRTSGPKMRVCYNCDDKFHFVAECLMLVGFQLKQHPVNVWGNNNLTIRHRQEAGRGFEACWC